MSTNRPIIAIDQLSKAYGYMPVLKHVSLNIARGQAVGLLGGNGSGKSTLLKLIAGIVKPSNGSIRVGGWLMPQEARQVRAQIGWVSHQSLLYDNLTALENLRFFAQLYNIDDQTHLQHLLEQVGLRRRAHSLVRTFSRGMQQRLSIARAMIHNPHILLLDEPYTGLDQQAAAILDDIIQQAHTDGHTLLIATHQLPRAEKLCNQHIILSQGKIIYDSTQIDNPPDLITTYAQLTGANTAT